MEDDGSENKNEACVWAFSFQTRNGCVNGRGDDMLLNKEDSDSRRYQNGTRPTNGWTGAELKRDFTGHGRLDMGNASIDLVALWWIGASEDSITYY